MPDRRDVLNISVRIVLVAALVWSGAHLFGDGWWVLAGIGIEAVALLQFALLVGVVWATADELRHGPGG
jgi:hypothetical protein